MMIGTFFPGLVTLELQYIHQRHHLLDLSVADERKDADAGAEEMEKKGLPYRL